MTLSCASKRLAVSAKLARVPVRCQQGTLGGFRFDCVPFDSRRIGQDRFCNRLTRRLPPNRPKTRGLAVMDQVHLICHHLLNSAKRGLSDSRSGPGTAYKRDTDLC